MAKAPPIQADITLLEPNARQKVELFLRRASEDGVPIRVIESRRTPARQKYLYAQGRTRPGKIVTNTLQSNHLTGNAVDVVFQGAQPYVGDWQRLIRLGESCGLRSLYPFESSHFEDDGTPFKSPPMPTPIQAPPEWANDFVSTANKAGITSNPLLTVDKIPLYQLFGIIIKLVTFLVKK